MCRQGEDANSVDAQVLYEQVLKEQVPFQQWQMWIANKLDQKKVTKAQQQPTKPKEEPKKRRFF